MSDYWRRFESHYNWLSQVPQSYSDSPGALCRTDIQLSLLDRKLISSRINKATTSRMAQRPGIMRLSSHLGNLRWLRIHHIFLVASAAVESETMCLEKPLIGSFKFVNSLSSDSSRPLLPISSEKCMLRCLGKGKYASQKVIVCKALRRVSARAYKSPILALSDVCFKEISTQIIALSCYRCHSP